MGFPSIKSYFNLRSGDFMKPIVYAGLFGCLLGAANIFAGADPANAQETSVTAGDVTNEDPATLRAFVEYAKSQLDDVASSDELAVLWGSMRLDGDWKSGNTYLVVLNSRGSVLFHAGQSDAEGKTLRWLVDARRDSIGKNILREAAAGGGFVGYYWDDPAVEGDDSGHPKVAYATQLFSEVTNENHIVVGGFYRDLADLPVDPGVSVPRPDITASEVVDRETLKAFVESALKAFSAALETIGLERVGQIRDIFRDEGGYWKHGSIYAFVVTTAGYVVFHGADPEREGRLADMDIEDANGVKIVQELFRAAREGGGFVEYTWDDPTVDEDGDGELLGDTVGSFKVSYALLHTHLGVEYVVAAGIYRRGPDFDEDGSVGFSDFLLFARHYGLNRNDAGFDGLYDLNSDDEIGFQDFVLFATDFGKRVRSN